MAVSGPTETMPAPRLRQRQGEPDRSHHATCSARELTDSAAAALAGSCNGAEGHRTLSVPLRQLAASPCVLCAWARWACPLPTLQGDAVLAKAKTTYEGGDRLQAMKLYEDVLADVSQQAAQAPLRHPTQPCYRKLTEATAQAGSRV
jgi:hypothetical protein